MRRSVTFVAWVVIVTILCAPVVVHADGFQGVWKNQRGSYLVINSVQPNGAVDGYYVNYASGTGCQGTPFTLVGWAYSNTITFSVLWRNAAANCNSQTGWAGYLRGNGIITNWNLVTTLGQFQAGQDVFNQVSLEVRPSLLLDESK